MRTINLNRSSIRLSSVVILLFLIWGFFSWKSFAQTFVKLTDPGNPVVTTPTDGNYSGAAWIDFDNDGDLDLYTTKNFLFRNLGSGNFERVNSFSAHSQTNQLGNGTSWADFDNDGDIDLFLSGNPSLVYSNNGSGIFEPLIDGPLGESAEVKGWTGAWADYNNNGFVDIVIAIPDGFLGNVNTASKFFENNRDGRFRNIDSFQFTTVFAPYTVSTWSDYDLDGDIDLFIGSGPANGTTARDFLYNNKLIETGTADFTRINTNPIGTDLQDGQVWNWIDHDNDGDLDAMLTNYSGAPNRFYKNNSGVYVSINNSLTVGGSFLGNCWGDIDNDGDLDVILTNEGTTQVFTNDGNDTFTLESNFSGGARSTALGDYDDDGDLDMFVSGTSGKGLYENVSSNGNNWISYSLEGTISNKSAIGAKVKILATINGNPVWQFREISAQNNFNGHSSLRVHFGLGDATTIDSVMIIWPSGQLKILTNVAVNNFYTVTEEIPSGYLRANFTADVIEGEEPLTVVFTDLSLADPNSPINSWQWDFDNDGIIDATAQNPTHEYLANGSYSVKLITDNDVSSDTLTRADYITVNKVSGIQNETNNIPDEFSLEQNYPNPFNPNTKIKFTIAEASFVNLMVYNILGSVVSVLVSEEKTPGFYELNFGGENLPSGIYVYRLEAGDFTSSKKMLLIK